MGSCPNGMMPVRGGGCRDLTKNDTLDLKSKQSDDEVMISYCAAWGQGTLECLGWGTPPVKKQRGGSFQSRANGGTMDNRMSVRKSSAMGDEKQAHDEYYRMGGDDAAANQSVEMNWCCNFFFRGCCLRDRIDPEQPNRPNPPFQRGGRTRAMGGAMGSGTCPSGQHMMPNGSCMNDSDMGGGYRRGGTTRPVRRQKRGRR